VRRAMAFKGFTIFTHARHMPCGAISRLRGKRWIP
jgi:hypothetical protein